MNSLAILNEKRTLEFSCMRKEILSYPEQEMNAGAVLKKIILELSKDTE